MEIRTKLIDRVTEFKLLAVSMESEIPILLVGNPGTAKTQLVLDFCQSLGLNTIFKQLSYDTRKEEFYGYIDPVALTQKGELRRIGGLDENTEALLIDEVDKANSQNRNLLLSILRERKIFDGSRMRDLSKLKLIVGTTNIDIKETSSEAFLDRFVIKAKVNPLGFDMLFGRKLKEYTLNIEKLQEKEEVEDVFAFIANAVKKYHVSLTDRTVVTLNHLIPVLTDYLEGYELYKVVGLYVLGLEVTDLNNILPRHLTIMSEIEKALEDLDRVKDPVKRVPIQGNLVNLANELRQLGREDKAKELLEIIATKSIT
ncbi:MAG: AAA domain-containing protein [Ignavibacteria bacterium]|nr:AAA domain-containing protein [Ignavibacteria bacterium]